MSAYTIFCGCCQILDPRDEVLSTVGNIMVKTRFICHFSNCYYYYLIARYIAGIMFRCWCSHCLPTLHVDGGCWRILDPSLGWGPGLESRLRMLPVPCWLGNGRTQIPIHHIKYRCANVGPTPRGVGPTSAQRTAGVCRLLGAALNARMKSTKKGF